MTTKTHPRCLSASTLSGDPVKNPEGENLGSIKELMIDVSSGRVAYAVLSFGGVLGLGDRLFAIPWDALSLNTDDHSFVLDCDKQKLKDAPGFDKDEWPDFADPMFHQKTYAYYRSRPYWD